MNTVLCDADWLRLSKEYLPASAGARAAVERCLRQALDKAALAAVLVADGKPRLEAADLLVIQRQAPEFPPVVLFSRE